MYPKDPSWGFGDHTYRQIHTNLCRFSGLFSVIDAILYRFPGLFSVIDWGVRAGCGTTTTEYTIYDLLTTTNGCAWIAGPPGSSQNANACTAKLFGQDCGFFLGTLNIVYFQVCRTPTKLRYCTHPHTHTHTQREREREREKASGAGGM